MKGGIMQKSLKGSSRERIKTECLSHDSNYFWENQVKMVGAISCGAKLFEQSYCIDI